MFYRQSNSTRSKDTPNTMPPTLKQLVRRHSEHMKYAEQWMLLSALAEGGCAVDDNVKKKLLINPDDAEPDVYSTRIRLAPYEPIMGSILMKLVSQITQDQASYEGSTDPFWEDEFFPNGVLSDEESDPRQSLQSLLIREMLQGLVQGKMIAQVDTASAAGETLAEQQANGGDSAYVVLRRREELWDWASDNQGLIYAKLHTYREERPSWDAKPVRLHEFQIYQRESNGQITTSIYTVRNSQDDKATDYSGMSSFGWKDLLALSESNAVIEAKVENQPIFSTTSGLFRFPVICRSIPKPLVIADQLFDLVRSHYNHVAGGEWALVQTNYAMPVFTGVDYPHEEGNSNPARFQKAGNGFWWELPPGVDCKWFVRPGSDIQLSLDYQDRQKQKMLDLVHKIADTAANAYAMRMQSGESKKEGRRDLDILLEVYGEELRGFAKSILDAASIVRNEDTEWSVNGFTDYNTTGLMEALQEYTALDQAGIDSDTLKRESRIAIANKAVASLNLSPTIVSEIADEIGEDSPFTLQPEGMNALVQLAGANLISPGDLHQIFQKAGIIPPDMDLMALLRNLGLEPGLPQTDNPVLAGDE